MDRPARKSKVINYCDLDDDEDFASSKPPASKKPREEIKPALKKPSSKTSSQDLHPQPSANHSNRKPPDQKLHERDLEAALTLSLLHGTKDCHVDLSPTTSLTPTLHTEQYPTMGLSPTAEVEDGRRGEEREDPSPLLFSNCSVNGNLLGLDNIQAERGSSKVKSSPRTGEPPRNQHPDQDPDEDYKPRLTPESESDDHSSGVAESESEEEEFTVRKVIKKSKKETKKMKTKTPPPPRPPPQTSSKKDKLTSKAKPPAAASTPVRTAASTPLRTPTSANQSSGSRRPPPPSPASPPCAPAASPAGGSRVSKWNPPGQLGSSPSPSQGSVLRSPAGGLRLGLSRRVRVKPLHPSVASH